MECTYDYCVNVIVYSMSYLGEFLYIDFSHYKLISLFLCIPNYFCLDTKYSEFYAVECPIFFCVYF